MGFGNRSGGGGFGNKNKGGGGFGNNKKKSNFVRIGSLTVSKETVKKLGDEVVGDLKDSGIKLWAGFYLPKGVESLTITNETKLLISLEEVKGAPGFVVGRVVFPDDSE